jgi:predicted MFS family arabinose efflux permease
MAEAIRGLPAGAFVLVVIAWGLGALTGSAVATGVSRRVGPGYLIGVLLLAAAIGNMLMIPHPVWMWIGGIIVILLGMMIGARLAARQRLVPPRDA